MMNWLCLLLEKLEGPKEFFLVSKIMFLGFMVIWHGKGVEGVGMRLKKVGASLEEPVFLCTSLWLVKSWCPFSLSPATNRSSLKRQEILCTLKSESIGLFMISCGE